MDGNNPEDDDGQPTLSQTSQDFFEPVRRYDRHLCMVFRNEQVVVERYQVLRTASSRRSDDWIIVRIPGNTRDICNQYYLCYPGEQPCPRLRGLFREAEFCYQDLLKLVKDKGR